jgi:hypothetical protein
MRVFMRTIDNYLICVGAPLSKLRQVVLGTVLSVLMCPTTVLLAESKMAPEASFSPTWKLLRNDAKQQFVAGYLFGWRDAKRVTDIAIDYVKEKPTEAVKGLERIRGIYDMEGLTAESVVRELDTYFAQAEGKEATFSQAITAVRTRLGR